MVARCSRLLSPRLVVGLVVVSSIRSGYYPLAVGSSLLIVRLYVGAGVALRTRGLWCPRVGPR